jgi:hypothetical protein
MVGTDFQNRHQLVTAMLRVRCAFVSSRDVSELESIEWLSIVHLPRTAELMLLGNMKSLRY